MDLEVVSDKLAGPMRSVLKCGNHDYVYADTEGRFTGVVDAPSFRVWALGVVSEYEQMVAKFSPITDEEALDHAVFLQVARSMRLAIQASEEEILRARARAG